MFRVALLRCLAAVCTTRQFWYGALRSEARIQPGLPARGVAFRWVCLRRGVLAGGKQSLLAGVLDWITTTTTKPKTKTRTTTTTTTTRTTTRTTTNKTTQQRGSARARAVSIQILSPVRRARGAASSRCCCCCCCCCPSRN